MLANICILLTYALIYGYSLLAYMSHDKMAYIVTLLEDYYPDQFQEILEMIKREELA